MWIDDGSNCVKCEPDSPEFRVEDAPGGEPVNARWSAPLASGQYFEVDMLSLGGCAFLGVTTEESHKKGWYCKGLFFGGNLSDGGGLVRQNFGEWLKTGMKIGVLTELEGETITLTYYQDGRCLGPAFAAKRLTDKDVYPVVHTDTSGDRFAIRFPGSAPAERKRQPKGGGTAHPAEGHWQLKKLFVGPELGEFPLADKLQGEHVKLDVEAEGPGTFRLAARVANNINLSATSEPDEALAPFEKLTPAGPPMCTMMMGPDGHMETEGLVCGALESLQKWLVRDGELLLVGPTAEMSLVPGVEDGEGLPATEVELP